LNGIERKINGAKRKRSEFLEVDTSKAGENSAEEKI